MAPTPESLEGFVPDEEDGLDGFVPEAAPSLPEVATEAGKGLYRRGVSALNSTLFGGEEPNIAQRTLRDLSEVPGETLRFGKQAVGFANRSLDRWDRSIEALKSDPNATIADIWKLSPAVAFAGQAKEDLPEEGKLEAGVSALGSVAVNLIPELRAAKIPVRIAASIASGVISGETANQIKQALGMSPDTPFTEDLQHAYDATVKGLGTFALLHGGSKVAAGTARNAARILDHPTSKFETFLDKDVQRARAFTENPRYSKTRQGVPLTEALAEDDVRPLLEIDVPNDESRFPKILENVKNAKVETGKAIDDIVIKAGNGKSVKLKDLDLSPVRDQATGQTEVVSRPAKDVLRKEYDQWAREVLTPDELRQWEVAQRDIDIKTSPSKAIKLSAPERARLAKAYNDAAEAIDRLGTKIENGKEFSLQQLREMKSKFDNQGNYGSLTDKEAANRADVYRDLGHAFRKKIGEVVGLDAEGNVLPGLSPEATELATQYKKTNRRFQTLSDIEPLIEGRIRESAIEGPSFSTAEFKDRSGGIPKAVTAAALPERAIPEARLERADTRYHSGVKYPFLDLASRGMRAGTSALQGIDKAAEGFSGNFVRQPGNVSSAPLVLPPQGIAASSALGTLNADRPAPLPTPALPDLQSEPRLPVPTSPGIFQSALNALGPQSAMAEEMPAPAPQPPRPMPRESDAFFAAPDAMLPPDLPPEAVELIKVGRRSDPLVRRQAMSDLMTMNVIPFEEPAHEWLKGFPVVDGRILDPARVISFNEMVLEKEKAGKIGLKQSMRIRSAVNAGEPVIGFLTEVDPDGEVLPPQQPAPEPAPTPETTTGEEGAKMLEPKF